MPGKIKYFPTEKENYIAYHKILWQAIIDELKALKQIRFKRGGNYKLAHTFKVRVFNKLFEFDGHIKNHCFPCSYSVSGYSVICKECLLDANNDHEGDCLDGMWNNFNWALEEKNKKDAIKYARKIKNFPIRK